MLFMWVREERRKQTNLRNDDRKSILYIKVYLIVRHVCWLHWTEIKASYMQTMIKQSTEAWNSTAKVISREKSPQPHVSQNAE